MCCIGELVCLVFGIVTIAQGQFKLSRKRVLEGTKAYVFGAMLIGLLPGMLLLVPLLNPPPPQALKPNAIAAVSIARPRIGTPNFIVSPRRYWCN